MKPINLIGRLGNKQNDIKYFKDKLPIDVVNVIEPFGGSYAVIRNIYMDDKYNKFVNDNDTELYNIYTHSTEYAEYCKTMNEMAKKHIINDCVNKKNFMEDVSSNNLDKSPYFNYWKNVKISRDIHIKTAKSIDYTKSLEDIKKITFTNNDYLEVINKYRTDPNCFIFLDPPYLFSDNSSYQKQSIDKDCTDILVNIYNILKDKKTKAKIMLVINDLKIIRWMFNGFIKSEYSKTYGISFRVDSHLVICNYD